MKIFYAVATVFVQFKYALFCACLVDIFKLNGFVMQCLQSAVLYVCFYQCRAWIVYYWPVWCGCLQPDDLYFAAIVAQPYCFYMETMKQKTFHIYITSIARGTLQLRVRHIQLFIIAADGNKRVLCSLLNTVLLILRWHSEDERSYVITKLSYFRQLTYYVHYLVIHLQSFASACEIVFSLCFPTKTFNVVQKSPFSLNIFSARDFVTS